MDNNEGDPFACFDGSDDDEEVPSESAGTDTNNTVTTHDNTKEEVRDTVTSVIAGRSGKEAPTQTKRMVACPRRDRTCGVLAFHPNTERSLLTHVQNDLERKRNNNKNNNSHNNNYAEMVLNSIDEYCLSRHWMMHVGPEKGEIVEIFLDQCLQNYHSSSNNFETPLPSFTTVELGTYCGYSAIRLTRRALQTLRALFNKQHKQEKEQKEETAVLRCDKDFDFHLYTVEVDPAHAEIAKQMIRLAQLENWITVVLFEEYDPYNNIKSATATTLNAVLQQAIDRNKDLLPLSRNNHTIDFLFMDHDKDRYLSDLQHLEETSDWIKKGTYVAADNVVFARIDNYCHYVTHVLQNKHRIVTTRLVGSRIEYYQPEHSQRDDDDDNGDDENDTKDGVGKLEYRTIDVGLVVLTCGTNYSL